jgi:hypothetical protein
MGKLNAERAKGKIQSEHPSAAYLLLEVAESPLGRAQGLQACPAGVCAATTATPSTRHVTGPAQARERFAALETQLRVAQRQCWIAMEPNEALLALVGSGQRNAFV